jgi:hypothetical protein
MRENCTYGSEGGEGHTLPDPYRGLDSGPRSRMGTAPIQAHSVSDFYALFIRVEWLETIFQRFEGGMHYEQFAFQVVALFDPLPRLLICAGETIKARIGADLGYPTAGLVTLLARPEIKVKDHFQAELCASRPNRGYLTGNPPIVLREQLDQRIAAVKAGHPLVVAEPYRGKAFLEATGKCRLARAQKAVNQNGLSP